MKNTLITGGTRGIGLGIVEKFVQSYDNVIVIYKNSDDLAKKLQNEYENVKCFKCDVSKSTEVKDTIKIILDTYKNIDVLINNAGISTYALLQDTKDSDFDEIFDANVKGTYNVTREILPSMISNKKGVILNISSMWGEVGCAFEVLYSATKGAINAFSKALAKEVGPSNIRVNAICPGVIKTDMLDGFSKEDLDDLIDKTPLQAIGTPNDVAETCYFLASDACKFITGATIPVNGGFSIT